MTFKMQEEVFLDKFNKCYVKILTLNKKPENSPKSSFWISLKLDLRLVSVVSGFPKSVFSCVFGPVS